MSLNSSQIAKLLSRYISSEEAAKRAAWIEEDMSKIGFTLDLDHENPEGMWLSLGVLPQAEYKLPGTQFSIDAKIDDQALSGSFVTTGNLLRLSQTIVQAHTHLSNWPDAYSKRFLNVEHLNLLNEIWWLKFWRSLVKVEAGPKANKASPDFEWRLTIKDGFAVCNINFEVKRRVGNINGIFKRGKSTLSLDGILHKFGVVNSDTANVVALTSYSPLGTDERQRIKDWVDKHPHVHGILIWTEGNLGTEPLLSYFSQSKAWAGQLLNAIDDEDLKVACHHKGTLCTQKDAPAFIARLAEEARSGSRIIS